MKKLIKEATIAIFLFLIGIGIVGTLGSIIIGFTDGIHYSGKEFCKKPNSLISEYNYLYRIPRNISCSLFKPYGDY